ncbi:MAG: type VII toxin-antitoxin system HepT family RNase toxin [Syntrophobacteraceae bacterium]
MIDTDLLLIKAGNVRKHLKRVHEKCDPELDAFLSNRDHQDIVCFNLQMAIQNCVDIAAHVVSDLGAAVPGSVNEMFYFLEENDILSSATVETMVKAVGFRNILVHEYGKLDLQEVFAIAHHHSKDLDRFLLSLFEKLRILDA